MVQNHTASPQINTTYLLFMNCDMVLYIRPSSLTRLKMTSQNQNENLNRYIILILSLQHKFVKIEILFMTLQNSRNNQTKLKIIRICDFKEQYIVL